MQLPIIKHVSVTSQPEGGVLAEVSFGENLNPAQEKYLKTVFDKYAKRLGIKLARSIDGRRITFRQLGKSPVPEPETIQQLLNKMDIGTVDPTPIPTQVHRKSTGKTSTSPDSSRHRRQTIVSRDLLVSTAAAA